MSANVLRLAPWDNVLRHERFERAPMHAQKRRRGRLPRGVEPLRRWHTLRLKPGALVEIIGLKNDADNGKRARVVDFDVPSADGHSFKIQSLNGPLVCNDGDRACELWLRPVNLRRVWTGLTEDERIKLRLLRGAS